MAILGITHSASQILGIPASLTNTVESQFGRGLTLDLICPEIGHPDVQRQLDVANGGLGA